MVRRDDCSMSVSQPLRWGRSWPLHSFWSCPRPCTLLRESTPTRVAMNTRIIGFWQKRTATIITKITWKRKDRPMHMPITTIRRIPKASSQPSLVWPCWVNSFCPCCLGWPSTVTLPRAISVPNVCQPRCWTLTMTMMLWPAASSPSSPETTKDVIAAPRKMMTLKQVWSFARLWMLIVLSQRPLFSMSVRGLLPLLLPKQ
mmetsp:Transcript_5429/g.12359  ORF Transcript_5429/g.12359 Transcript_5429/m.12359 type:complete len:201 (-) Transcript_5429:727-1329(-)